MKPAPLELPDDDWSGWLDTYAHGRLRDAADRVAALKAAEPGDAAVLDTWNDAGIALADAAAICSVLSAVHPEPEVVSLAERIETEVRAFTTDLYLDPDAYGQLAALDADTLDEGARRVLEFALRDYRRSGVDREAEVRERVRALDQRLTDLAQTFARNVRDGRRTTQLPEAGLAGLPEDYVADHPADDEGLVTVSTDYPDTHPFLAYATDAEARRRVAATFFDLAYPVNEGVLHDLLETRHEKATLLGYADWPSFDAEVKMIGSGPAIGEFVDRVAADADAAGRRDLDVLRERAAADGVPEIDLSSSRYYVELVRRERYEVDAQEVRRYFDFARVQEGVLALTGRLFGVEFVPIDQAEARTWHAEVASFDVVLDGERLGRIHLDLHPRAGKFNHAAQFDLVPGIAGRQLAEGVLVCNLARGLLEHREVVTLFHEFGHLLHHVLAGRHPWVRFSGVATEWDFVEAPSQLLEEWAWDPAVLSTFAVDASGAPIPAELVARMRAAEEFGKAFLARTQTFYAALSYRLHLEQPADLTARMLELYDEYSLVEPLPDTHFFAGFGHLTDYGSAYYTYLWSLVIAKDLFSVFDAEDLLAAEVARRYRDAILVPGGSRDAADLVEDFLGRPYDTAAFQRWLEGSPEAG